jgi:hypothetical protein
MEAAILPPFAITNVMRLKRLPVMPNWGAIVRDWSLTNSKGACFSALYLARVSGLSGLMPRMVALADVNAECASRYPRASRFHPGVKALGKK